MKNINTNNENILILKEKDNNIISESRQFSNIVNELKGCKYFNENFELKKYIYSGSESKVFLIENKKWKNKLVLKYLINKPKKNMNELKIASKLKNKNIIILQGSFPQKEKNSQFFIMENANYGNLGIFHSQILKRSIIPETLLCFLTYQILKGLEYCHRCKIAHMDIKSQNIVIDECLNAKLIDFSISINYANKKPNDKIKLPPRGTAFYMSEEIINSKIIEYKDLNKVDAYALGVLLFTSAFGYYPYNLKYEDKDNYEIINEKLNGDLGIKNINNLSTYFIDFITKLLEKDINKRMSIYEAIRHPWIKGAEILLDEKENTYNAGSFLAKMITNNFKNFNDYIGK